MTILNRENANFPQSVWSTIDSEFAELLSQRLKLRSVIDFNDTLDFNDDAVSTGKTKKLNTYKECSVSVREPIKTVEIKHSFVIPNQTIEDIKRGLEDFDNTAMQKAANEFAKMENRLILEGIKEASIDGILPSIPHKELKASSATDMLGVCAKCLELFDGSFINGNFKLVLSNSTNSKLAIESIGGISIRDKIIKLLGDPDAITVTNALGEGKAMLIAQRGGDFEFFSGLDVSIGYESDKKDGVELFLIESCAFRVITPEAALIIDVSSI